MLFWFLIGADVDCETIYKDFRTNEDVRHGTALHLAVKHRKFMAVQILLDYKATFARMLDRTLIERSIERSIAGSI